MQEKPYANEDLLQTLVERHPELLAGDQMNTVSPRRWLLISREMAIPDDTDASGRWSLDHLFVDQDGIPTLVEVKRSSDTRIRREVVGQMMDYAANGVVFWPVGVMQNRFEGICKARNEEPQETLSRFLDSEDEEAPDSFWETVDGNLRSGRIRLVFLADQIPVELQRVVEFLNEQMPRVDVIAVELKQFVGEGIQTLVPRLIGQTAFAKQKKVTQDRRKWDQETFLAVLTENKGGESATTAKNIIERMQQNTDALDWGTGTTNTAVKGVIKHDSKTIKPFLIYSSGRVEVAFEVLAKWPMFADPAQRHELREKLNAIEGIDISQEGVNAYAKFSLAALHDSASMRQFLSAFDWVVGKIRQG